MCHTARNTTAGAGENASFEELSRRADALYKIMPRWQEVKNMNGKTTKTRDGHTAKMRRAKLICIHHPGQPGSRTIPEGSQPAAVQQCEQQSGPEIRGQNVVVPGSAAGAVPVTGKKPQEKAIGQAQKWAGEQGLMVFALEPLGMFPFHFVISDGSRSVSSVSGIPGTWIPTSVVSSPHAGQPSGNSGPCRSAGISAGRSG